MRFICIRHGKTAGNLKGAYVGRTDEALCEQGREALTADISAGGGSICQSDAEVPSDGRDRLSVTAGNVDSGAAGM